MAPLKVAAVLVAGLALSGCDGALDGYTASSSQNAYPASGYYGPPGYSAPGYVAAPVYPVPGYYPQPGYVTPYPYNPGWERGRDNWHEHEWHEHGEHGYQNDSRQPRDERPQAPLMATQPHSVPAPPPMAAPPPVARPQADQNKKLMDQLGFRPSR